MRKIVITLFVAGLLVGGAASAQGMSTGPNLFAGVSIGTELISGVALFPIAVHFGAYDIGIQGLGARADASYWIRTGGLFELGLDGLYKYPVMTDLSVYGGLGPRLVFATGGGSAFGMAVVGGGEYMVMPQVGVTGELNVTSYFGALPTLFGFSIGVNYYF